MNTRKKNPRQATDNGYDSIVFASHSKSILNIIMQNKRIDRAHNVCVCNVRRPCFYDAHIYVYMYKKTTNARKFAIYRLKNNNSNNLK